jgi:cobalt-zinc-cadmium efflux system outer membrane protein
MMFQRFKCPPHFTRPMAPVALALAVLAGGCASLDPKADIDRAAHTVTDRSGVAPGWDGPWEASLTTWDGRSPLTVELALGMALRNNRDIRSEVELIAASRADLVQAGLLPNPVVGLTLRFPFDPVSGGTFVGAQLVQSFTALWLRGGKIRAADARLNQTVLDVSDKALALVAEVQASHTRIAFGQRAVALAEQNLATIQKSINSLDARVRGGEGTTLDVNRARQQLAKADAERVVVMRELAKERRRMLELIGFAAENADWAVDEGALVSAPQTLDEATVITLAGSQRLDVAASRSVALALSADLSVEQRSRLRDLGLGADFERSESGDKSIGPVVELAIPIFDTNEAQIAKAGSMARAALATHEAVAQRAVREARVAWIELDSAARLLEQYRTTVLALSEHNLTLAEAALKAGQADVTVLLDAQREVIEARRTLNDLERDARLARVALEEAVGGRLAAPEPAKASGAQGPSL